jgi:hypothetical protein
MAELGACIKQKCDALFPWYSAAHFSSTLAPGFELAATTATSILP